MDILKIILASCVAMLLFQSCGSEGDAGEMVSYEIYEAAIEEYKALNARQAETIQITMENERIINEVVTELRALTTATGALRVDVESGRATTNTPDEIKARLAALKAKLNEASRNATADEKRYIQTISNLQTIIVQKEKEIDQLKQEIKDQQQQIQQKNQEIQQKATTIKKQELTIAGHQQELERAQIKAWTDMGSELYQIAASLPVVKGKKDKNNMSNAKAYILFRAKECYIQAEKMGSVTAGTKAKKIEREIAAL